MNIEKLDAALRKVAPIVGVAIVDPLDRATWRIDFDESASGTQRAIALDLMQNFVFTRSMTILEPDQFWFALRVSGYESDIKDWVASLQELDPVSWAAASAKLDFAKFFERDHPFVEAAREAIGMSEEELDALWQYAVS